MMSSFSAIAQKKKPYTLMPWLPKYHNTNQYNDNQSKRAEANFVIFTYRSSLVNLIISFTSLSFNFRYD